MTHESLAPSPDPVAGLPTIPYHGLASILWVYLGRRIAKRLAETRGQSISDARRNLNEHYRAVLSRTPDIKPSPLRFNIVWGALMIAVLETFEDLTQDEFRYATRLMMENRLIDAIKGRIDLYDTMEKKAHDYQAVNAFDWSKTTDLSKVPHEFVTHFTQCGLCTLFEREGKLEWLPLCCELDYLMMGDSTIDLLRTKTLAKGFSDCEFRILNNKLNTREEVMAQEGITADQLL